MSRELIKKYIVPLSALLFSLILLFYSLDRLGTYDYSLVSFTHTVTWDDNHLIKSTIDWDVESAIFNRSERVYISDEWNKIAFTTVYNCSEKYFEIMGLPRINGRFLWDSDSWERRNYAVIDENLATFMFAGKECLGEKIIVGGAEYFIIGVCGSEDGMLTSVEEYAVYLPVDAYYSYNTQGGCLMRAQNEIKLTFALQKGIIASNGIKSVDNLKARSGMWSMPARLALLIIYILVLMCAVKIIVKYTSLRISEAQIELEDMYIKQYLEKHALFIGIHLAALLVLYALFVLWFRAVSFTVVVDAKLIPRSLIDVMGWVDNIRAYTRNRNSAQNIPFSPSYQIGVYGWFAVASSVVCICAANKLLQNLKAWIYEILESNWT